MTTDEIVDAIAREDEEAAVSRAQQLANWFRGNAASLESLSDLLAHPDPRAIGIGLWIASEVSNGERGRELLQQVQSLLNHTDASIRFAAVRALSGVLKPGDDEIVASLIARINDEAPSVRGQALIELARLEDSVLPSFEDGHPWKKNVALLRREADPRAVSESLESTDVFERRLAAVACVRHQTDEYITAATERTKDPEIKELMDRRWMFRGVTPPSRRGGP